MTIDTTTITVVLGVRAFHRPADQIGWPVCDTLDAPGTFTTAEQAMQSHHLPPCRACYPGGYIDVRGDEGLVLNYYRGRR